jgi:trk system potassium uptake protein TrkA
MHIIIAGGGTVGEQVARASQESGSTAVVIEADAGRAADLAARGVQVVPGNACAARTLEEAGALRADVLVACTGLDEDNLVISLLARRHLEIPRVVALVNDDASRWLFGEPWGVDAAISAASALVALIGEAAPAGAGRRADLAGPGA